MKKNDNRLRYREYYRRNLPHIQPKDSVIFVSYRLYYNLPRSIKEKLEKIKEEKRGNSFKIIDDYLDLCKEGPKWLQDERIANVVRDNLLKMNKVQYELHCFCIMPNHVHVLLKPKIKFRNIPYSLAEIFRGHKGVTARKANLILHRCGQFWHEESYDHYIRNDEEFYNIAWYIIMNPVKAKLVKHYREWKFTWIEKDLEYELELDIFNRNQ